MKSKRLLIFIAVVAIVLVVMIVLSAIFSVKSAWVVYHRFDGTTIASPVGAPTIDDVLKQTKGKNIIFLSKSETLKNLQTDNWHAISVVKTFPNKVTVHFIERALAAKIFVGGEFIYIDSMGNVIEKRGSADNCVDISSVFAGGFDIASQQINQPLTFASEANNNRLQQVLQAILAVWRCNVELPDIGQVIGEDNVFTYENDNLVITMPSGAKLVVNAPQKNLQDRLLDAFSVYFNGSIDLKQPGKIITVREDGKITTDK